MALSDQPSNDGSQDEPVTAAEEAKSPVDVAPPEQAGASALGAAVAIEETKGRGGGRIGRYRWLICALLFFATTINYIDRQVLSILAPQLGAGPAQFLAADIRDPDALLTELRQARDPLSRYLQAQIAAREPRLLSAGNAGAPASQAAPDALAGALTGVIQDASLYGRPVSAQVTLTDNDRETIAGLLKSKKPEDVARTNRLILEKAYPQQIARGLRWNEIEYGNIVLAFQAAYAIGLLSVGSLMDRFGTRRGFALTIVFWSLAAMAHALAHSAGTFGVARFALGLGEAGNFPAAIKTVAEWFPKKERALATGVFNAGSNVGAIAAPLMVPWIAVAWGWRWAFILTGVLGFFWLACWLLVYRRPEEHPRLSRAELALINSDPAEPTSKIPWANLLPHRQTWAFALGKFLTDPVWWFFLFWLPKFFTEAYGLSLTGLALPLIVIYVVADVGSIGGGWLSSNLIARGYSVNAGRKIAMLVCALCVTPMIVAAHVHNLWVTVALISLAAAAHQGWSANLYTLVSDTFPRRAVGSVVGIGGMAGAVGGMVAAAGIGHLLQWTGNNYVPLLTIAGFAYLLALLVIHLLAPKLEPAMPPA